MFITLPIFLIIYRVVTIVRPLKATTLFGIWNFALTPVSQIFSSQFTHLGWTYIFFLILVIPCQFLSMKIPQFWARKRNRSASAVSGKGEKQQKRMRWTQNIFAIVMGVIVAVSATGVGVYWFLNALFSLAQSYIMHRVILRNRRKGGKLMSRLEALGIS
jgi:YidC/Oxa1 family membrane protein insertase